MKKRRYRATNVKQVNWEKVCCFPRYSARPFPDNFAPGETAFSGLFGIDLRTTG